MQVSMLRSDMKVNYRAFSLASWHLKMASFQLLTQRLKCLHTKDLITQVLVCDHYLRSFDF